MIIGHFNARGPNNGIEHWFDEIKKELIRRGHEVETFWLRGRQPTKKDIEKCDFLVFHFSQVADYYKRLGKPFCIVPSSNDFFVDKGETLRRAQSNKNFKFVTYQCEYTHQKFKEWNIKGPHVYFPMPARVDLFTRKKSFNPNGKIIAGGRLIAKKGLDRAIPYVDNLTVFGDGELKPYLKSLNPTTKFTGHLNGEELKDLFEEGWLYLFPAVVDEFGDMEGVSNTIKEAILMELQILTTTVGGNAELNNVYFLDDWNKKSIENAIESIPREPNIKGREEILKKYSPKVCVDRLLKGIEEYA